MYIKFLLLFMAGVVSLAKPHLSLAETYKTLADGHSSKIFHSIKLETDIGSDNHGMLSTWNLDGWIGNDINKLWLKSEGESVKGRAPEKSEYWMLYSRNISAFWDGQIGIRYDGQPNSKTYVAAGFKGLAPYLFETKAHLFISEDGEITGRLHKEKDFLISQKLITQPYVEVNFSAQDSPGQEVGSGITNSELGIQTRYEITRKFAPYIDLRYERKLGETSRIASKNRENRDNTTASIGVRLMF